MDVNNIINNWILLSGHAFIHICIISSNVLVNIISNTINHKVLIIIILLVILFSSNSYSSNIIIIIHIIHTNNYYLLVFGC